MFLKIAIFVLVVVVTLLVIAATKPNSFRVERSITIHASPERVFSFINDLHSWEAWSGDNEGDGTVQKIFSGPASGTGAVAEWHGSSRTGAAKMIITESVSQAKFQSTWIGPSHLKHITSTSLQFIPREGRQKSFGAYR